MRHHSRTGQLRSRPDKNHLKPERLDDGTLIDARTGEIFPRRPDLRLVSDQSDRANNSNLQPAPPHRRPTETEAKRRHAEIERRYNRDRRNKEKKLFEGVHSLILRQVEMVLRDRRRLPIPDDERGRKDLQALIDVRYLTREDLTSMASWASMREWMNAFECSEQMREYYSGKQVGVMFQVTLEEWVRLRLTQILPYDVDDATIEAYRKERRRERQRRYRARTGRVVKPKPREKAILDVISNSMSINDIAQAIASRPEFRKRNRRKMKPDALRRTIHRIVKKLIADSKVIEKFEGVGPKAHLMIKRA